MARDFAMTPTYARFASIGALVLTYLGAAWVVAALALAPVPVPPWLYAGPAAVVGALTFLAIVRIRRAGDLPGPVDATAAARRGKRTGIAFGAVFTFEFALIGASAAFLDSRGQSLLIPVAAAIIVGLHFFPLAVLFRIPVYHVTGVLCVALGLGALAIGDQSLRLLVLGVAFGVVLWASALGVLLLFTGKAPNRRIEPTP